jgi:hypothetical protein
LLRYGIIGQGRWGKLMRQILTAETGKVVTFSISRRSTEESSESYKGRIKKHLQELIEQIDVVWIAVPPGGQDILIESVLDFGKHAIIEKPWMCDRSTTLNLINYADFMGCQVAVHYQYCYLDGLIRLQDILSDSSENWYFWGEFLVKGINRLSIASDYNLGSHLIAIKHMLLPKAILDHIKTGYHMEGKRRIGVHSLTQHYELDFQNCKEPLIQRFIIDFDYHIQNNMPFSLGLKFSLDVNDKITKLRG